MLTYDLSKRGKAPLYDYLYQCIREDIITGAIRSGERLPSKRTLARHLNIGVITVTNAYAQLLTEGYITSVEKKGYFAADVSSYRIPKSSASAPAKDKTEPDYFADFKANRISLKSFPMTTWTRLMRETLSISKRELWQTIPWNGLFILRRAIADYLRTNRAMNVDPEQIIVGAGTEYLYSRLLQLFGPATTFAIEDPGYKKFGEISQSFGNPWKYVPIDDAGLCIDALEESGADVVHVSPANHFPTGIVMPVGRRIELFRWVNRISKRYIIEDDYDSEFRYTGKFILPLYAQDTQNRVIYLNTFSKTLVPSLRISYMVLPKKLLERYKKTQSFYSCTVSSFEQYTLALFLKRGYFERHINRMKKYYRMQRTAILDAIRRSPLNDFSLVTERKAGTHFLLTVNTALSKECIKKRAKKTGLHLSFFDDYRHAPCCEKNVQLVINYAGIPKEKIDGAVSRLAEIFR
ncbi:MAG: PLP-dependent aminotransferase family protein [Schwartzia succinivorans]|uniref:MocR-like pyridoxine biosynthesis transcription factor PdxR n=1 Tax=Schwartzia succinivorans TaxID=55507 RepID=UPI002355C3CC|nr:PLP-dependent aminotransferase family protein [Schwartzia succinivorans]MBE6097286.1 PLP-dependent aminotransferase family protein [Schwartzia succinivorans]